MADVKLPNGKIIANVPDDITQTEIIDIAIKNGIATPEDFGIQRPQPTGMDKVLGAAETGATIISSMFSGPASGYAGLAVGGLQKLGVPGLPEDAAVRAVESVQQGMTYQPRTEQGKANLQAINESFVGDVGRAMEGAGQTSGDFVYDLTGSPMAGALATTAPTVAAEAAGYKLGKLGTSLTRKAAGIETPSPATLERQSVVEAGKQANIPVMTSDVFPPESYATRLMQSLSEKLGPLGTGNKRVQQQQARQAAVESFIEAEGIDIDSPFAEGVVKSLNAKNAKIMEAAGLQRARAESALENYGTVPMNKALTEVDNLITEQLKLGPTANKEIVKTLEAYKQVLKSGGTFSEMRAQRTQLIKAMKAAERAEDTSPVTAYSKVKQAIDKDLIAFANKNDKQAAKDWLHSNRKMAEELQLAKETELKRVLESGDTTPEQIMPIIRGGKFSNLERLYGALGDKGRVNARKAIIQDALKDAGYFKEGGEVNPVLFENALNKPNRIAAVKVFFPGNEGKQLKSLMLALSKTRNAQSGQQALRTGEQVATLGTGGGLAYGLTTAPTTTITATALASGALKAYESPAFRNLLIRMANVDPKTAEYSKIVGEDSAVISGAAAAEMQKQSEQAPQMQDPQSMIDSQIRNQAEMIIADRGNSIVSAHGVQDDPRVTGIDLITVSEMPEEAAIPLLSSLYQNPAQAKIAENFMKVAQIPEYSREVQAIQNVLRNYSVIPPVDKEADINKMVAMGVKPEKAVKIANEIKTIKPKEANKLAQSIRAKLRPEMYADFADLINSVEALA